MWGAALWFSIGYNFGFVGRHDMGNLWLVKLPLDYMCDVAATEISRLHRPHP